MPIINLVYEAPTSRLPSEYQEVSYIQSSGTQWIDTGVYVNQNTIVETKWNLVQYNSNVNYDKIYGTYGSNGSSCFFLQSNKPENYKIQTVNYNNNVNSYKVPSTSAISTGTDYTTKHSNTQFRLNGTSQGTCSSSTFTSPSTIAIFAIHDGSSVTQNVYLKLYYFQIYDGSDLVRDLVPCYRKSDGVIGMYDLVNNQFYTNSGTGTFTKGSDIPITYSYRYIRRNINANRGNIAETQVSEFEICDSNGTKMSRPSQTSITCNYTYSDMQTYGPQKLIDGSTDTKWFVQYSTGIKITIDLGKDIDFSTYSKYKRYTANDVANRDPITWTLELSQDGTNWIEVSNISGASTTTTRKALAGTWDITLS